MRSSRPLLASSKRLFNTSRLKPPPLPLSADSQFLRRPLVRQYQHAAQSETVSNAVHIHKPRLNPKKWLYVTVTATSAYGLGVYILYKLNQALDVDESELDALDDHAGHDHDDDASIFIPFQWPQPTTRTFYKQSDPDWQEFVRMSNDEARVNSVREELANRCLKDISHAPKLRQVLGSNIELGQYWLDVKFPDRPPPEYVRKGVEISDEYIAWSQQTIPHSHYIQLRHMMYPKAIFAAAYTSVTIFTQLQWIKVKDLLGLDMTPKDKQLAAVCNMEKGRMQMEAMQAQLDSEKDASSSAKQRLVDQLKNSNAADSGLTPHLPGTTPTAAQTDPPSTPTSHPLLSIIFPAASDSSSDDQQIGQHPAVTYLRPSADMTLAWKTFLATLQMTWSRSRLDTQPKGALFIVGQVEVRGDRGRIRCDVQAAYDPKIAKIVYCICQVKHFWEWKQRAKGGP